jgi:hypothetical protein
MVMVARVEDEEEEEEEEGGQLRTRPRRGTQPQDPGVRWWRQGDREDQQDQEDQEGLGGHVRPGGLSCLCGRDRADHADHADRDHQPDQSRPPAPEDPQDLPGPGVTRRHQSSFVLGLL